MAAGVRETALKQVLRPEVNEQYLQVLLPLQGGTVRLLASLKVVPKKNKCYIVVDAACRLPSRYFLHIPHSECSEVEISELCGGIHDYGLTKRN